MAQGEPHAIRLDLQRALAQPATAGLQFREQGAGPGGETGRLAARPELWGDVILARKDIATSYHLAVVSDDALQGVTHVTRGQDLFHATHIHRLLQALLGLPEPVYRHHRLISDDTGRKLAKSAGDRSLRSLRAAGIMAADIRRQLGSET
jgi:glutamyl-Q tRNA(Asp) synthetase